MLALGAIKSFKLCQPNTLLLAAYTWPLNVPIKLGLSAGDVGTTVAGLGGFRLTANFFPLEPECLKRKQRGVCWRKRRCPLLISSILTCFWLRTWLLGALPSKMQRRPGSGNAPKSTYMASESEASLGPGCCHLGLLSPCSTGQGWGSPLEM